MAPDPSAWQPAALNLPLKAGARLMRDDPSSHGLSPYGSPILTVYTRAACYFADVPGRDTL